MMLLNVPYAEKDEAKALGARWNPTRRSWYVPDGVAQAPFARWASQQAPSARVDSSVGRTVTGNHVVTLLHDCNPFLPCPVCTAQLAHTPWEKTQQQLCVMLAAWPGSRQLHG